MLLSPSLPRFCTVKNIIKDGDCITNLLLIMDEFDHRICVMRNENTPLLVCFSTLDSHK